MDTIVVCPSCEKLNRVNIEKAEAARPICGSCKTQLPLHGAVQEVGASGLAKLIAAADRPVVVDFWAEWCGPCKAFAPTFQTAARELAGQFIFAKLNTEEHGAASAQYRIRSIPTLIVFKNGAEADRQSGAMPLAMLKQYLSRWGG